MVDAVQKERTRRIALVEKYLSKGFKPPFIKGNETSAISKAAAEIGISQSSLRNCLSTYERDGVTPDWTKYKPKNVHFSERLTDHRTKEETGLLKAQLKEAHAEIINLQDRLKDLEWASEASVKPASWTTSTSSSKGKSIHIPYLFNSDAQLGEVVRAEETEHGEGYNSRIYIKRYRKMIESAIDLAFNHKGSAWWYPGIILVRGGDTISGAIHDDLRETDDLTPIEACQLAFSEESRGIELLADAFGKVDIKDVGGGNHDRNTLKPRNKKTQAHSYDKLISFMLQKHFAKDKRVTFQVSESPDVVFPIFDMTILATHGDRIGSRGGLGFIGPAATVLRGAQKIVLEQAVLGRNISRCDFGHFHTFMYLGNVLVNGGMPGYSEYAKSLRMKPEPPTQTLLFHHTKGVVDIRPIYL